MNATSLEKKLFYAYGLDDDTESASVQKPDTLGIFGRLLENGREADSQIRLSQEADLRILKALREKTDAAKEMRERNRVPRMVFALAGSLALLAIIFIPLALIPKTRLVSWGPVTVDGRSFSSDGTLPSRAVIKVPSGSQAKIVRKGSFSIALGESSDFSYRALSIRKLQLSLMNGDAEFNFRKDFGDVQVNTINAAIKMTGTCFVVSADSGKGTTTVALKEGSLLVWNIAAHNAVRSMQSGDCVVVKGLLPPRDLEKGEPFAVKVIHGNAPTVKDVFSKSGVKERIHLRNGNIIVGKIISQEDGRITLRTGYADLTYENNDIEKIEYIR